MKEVYHCDVYYTPTLWTYLIQYFGHSSCNHDIIRTRKKAFSMCLLQPIAVHYPFQGLCESHSEVYTYLNILKYIHA